MESDQNFLSEKSTQQEEDKKEDKRTISPIFPIAYFATNKPNVALGYRSNTTIEDALISYIQNEKKQIRAALYNVTSAKIAQAIVEKANSGIPISLILDICCQYAKKNESLNPRDIKKKFKYDVLTPLVKAKNIETYIQYSNHTCHHKFCIFDSNHDDKKLFWNGSSNQTNHGNSINFENATVDDVSDLPGYIKGFEDEFDRIKKHCCSMNNKNMPNGELLTEKSKLLIPQQQCNIRHNPSAATAAIPDVNKKIFASLKYREKPPRKKRKRMEISDFLETKKRKRK